MQWESGLLETASTTKFPQLIRDSGPSLRSGFRLLARAPANRLKFDPDQVHQIPLKTD
jgi:hypothetical protein